MKSKLSTVVSVLLSIVLIAVGLVLGTLRGYSRERGDVIRHLTAQNGLMSVMKYRGADGLNFCAVAQRHIPGAQELHELETVSRALTESGGALSAKQEVDGRLDGYVSAVIALLESTDSYLASERDQRYVVMLQNDMISLLDKEQNSRFFSAADAFNQKLDSKLTGKLAAFLGVKPCTPDNVEYTGGSVRMPEKQDVLTDEANVLVNETSKDIVEYARMVQDEIDVNLHVALVHFTNGTEVKKYSEELFQHWNLGSDDLLIVGVVGENSFAMEMGSDVERKLSTSSVDNLFYTSTDFSRQFQAQQYDQAFGSLFRGMTDLLNKQYREKMKIGNLFAHTLSPSQQPQSTLGSFVWDNTLGTLLNPENVAEDAKSNGMGVLEWILLIGLILVIVNGSDPVRRAKRRHRGR